MALARALAKNAPLMLLTNPGQSWTEAARRTARGADSACLPARQSTVVYHHRAGEALAVGRHTAVMDEGELLQYGPTAEVFHRPVAERGARAFSDPR